MTRSRLTQSPEELVGEVVGGGGREQRAGDGGSRCLGHNSKVHSLVRTGSLMGVFFLLKSNLSSAHKGPATPPLADAKTPTLLEPFSGLTPRGCCGQWMPGLICPIPSCVPPTAPPQPPHFLCILRLGPRPPHLGHPRAFQLVCLRSQGWLPGHDASAEVPQGPGCWPTAEQWALLIPDLPAESIAISVGPAMEKTGVWASLC